MEAATFTAMRATADQMVPDEQLGLFADDNAFFRSGQPGQGRAVLDNSDLAAYDVLIQSLADSKVAGWIENGASRPAGTTTIARSGAAGQVINI